jgi:UDP-N-acetyl-D-mannosaminuronic acid dehydrogenase
MAPRADKWAQSEEHSLDLVIVGGCGHVGLPLALSFASCGLDVGIYDIDTEKMARVRCGEMPFIEANAHTLLAEVLRTGRLELSDRPSMLGRTDRVVLVIGTPIDEFMNPSVRLFERVVGEIGPQLRPEALVILRSTVFPGTTEHVDSRLRGIGLRTEVVFCPERVAEGRALEEIRSLPQLIGASSEMAFERASQLFAH